VIYSPIVTTTTTPWRPHDDRGDVDDHATKPHDNHDDRRAVTTTRR